jgi:aquaporin Z
MTATAGVYVSLCIMRAMPIRVYTGASGILQMKASFQKNWKHYLQEALGLALFMISACFFGALLESNDSSLHHTIPDTFLRTVIMGVLMGSTALFIFYSPFTSPSGSHINPAVTLTFLRIGKMCPWDSLFYILFQFIGGTLAVFIMQLLMGKILTEPPVNSAVTVPGAGGIWPALITEFIIAFITIAMVLFTSHHDILKKYTRIFSGCLVCTWVILAGPVSGFGMNPARSFASALPANIWTAFWIYLFVPFAGMMSAAEFFLFTQRKKQFAKNKVIMTSYTKKEKKKTIV